MTAHNDQSAMPSPTTRPEDDPYSVGREERLTLPVQAGGGEKPVRLTVITSDYGAAANVGGGVETYCRTFDLPKDIADYIDSQRGHWRTVTLAVEKTP